MTLLDCQEIAMAKDGKCLSFFFVNERQKIRWMCRNQHTFGLSVNQTKKGKWCEICRKRMMSIFLMYCTLLNNQ